METKKFTMSMFCNDRDLYKAKSVYYEHVFRSLVTEIECELALYVIDSNTCGLSKDYASANDLHVKGKALERLLGVLHDEIL